MSFFNDNRLPQYLEDALAPFSWSGIFSQDFRRSIVTCIYASNRKEVTNDFLKSLAVIDFLNEDWKLQLGAALSRFAEEGFPKRS